MSKIQNIEVRFNASSNFQKVKADLVSLKAQAAGLGSVFASNAYAKAPAVVDPAAWKSGTRAVHEASNAYRSAVSSSGLLTSQQIRATAESERLTKALQKQKLSFSDLTRNAGVMKQVYADQLRYQRMTAQHWGSDSAGRAITDITTPKNVPKDLDRIAQKMYFTGQMAQSAGRQIVNMGKNAQWAGRQLMVGFTYPVALFGAAAGVMAYKIDEAMTKVTKVYDVSAEAMKNDTLRAKELEDVRARSYKVSEDAARKYGQSIEDTLGIEQKLAATGLSGDALFDSVDAVSRISTLGDLDMTAATQMTISLQTAFKNTIKDANDLTEAFDYMNAVENATSLEIKDIAEMIPRAASAMSALGVTVQESTVLMTAMKEAGVDAAEGANALKSATGTILAPSPAAIKFIDSIAGPDIAESMANIRETTGGNLYQAIKQIYDLTSELAKDDRQAIIAKMFGKYQFNRVSAMVENLGTAFYDTTGNVNQTAKAMALMQEDAKDLGKRASNELTEKMKAASGEFKAAWHTMRIELGKLGTPFLQVATIIATGAKKVFEFANGLSDWKKKAALGVAAILALAGPIIMLGGLFANLAGQFVVGIGKMQSGLGRLGGAFKLVTKEEQAAKLSAEAQNAAMSKTGNTTNTLAQEINVLTAAYAKATAAARAYAEGQGVVAATSAAASKAVTQTTGTKAINGAPLRPYGPELPRVSGPIAVQYPRGATVAQKAEARAVALRAARIEEMKRLQAQEALNQKTAKEAALRNKISASINGASIAAGAMAASMLLMTTTSNETANNIGKWLMIGTIAAPAMTMLVNGGNAVVAGMGRALTAVRATTVGMTTMGGAMSMARAGAVRFGVALNAALGPVGWIALGLTAVAGAYFTIKKHNDKIAEKQREITKKQIEATKAMNTSTASIATNLGKAAGSYKQIVNAGGSSMEGTTSESNMLKSYNYYKSDDAGKEETKALQSNGRLLESDELIDKIRGKFIDLQVLGSDTAEQARTDVQGMLLAAGASAMQAADIANEVYKTYGDISKIDWAEPINDQIDILKGMAQETFITTGEFVGTAWVTSFQVDDNKKKLLYQQAEKSAEIFNQALASAATPADAKELIDQYMNAAMSEWQSGFDAIMASTGAGSDDARALFAEHGVDSGKAFSQAMRENMDFREAYEKMSTKSTTSVMLKTTMQQAQNFATAYENAFISPLAKSSWYLSDGVMTAVTALKQFNEAGIGLNADEATEKLLKENHAYQEYAEALREVNELKRHGVSNRSSEMLDAQNRLNAASKELVPIINGLNQTLGFKQGSTATRALAFLLGKVAKEAAKAKGEINAVDSELNGLETIRTVRINADQAGGVIQNAMGALQQRMADARMDAISRSWEDRIDAAQQGWDSRGEALAASHEAAMSNLENQQEAAQEAFDRRWEARRKAVEKAYEKRINGVKREIESEKKADEVRARLFEKEKKRLERLAELENTNIDFNTALNEGRLDDAAKTLNNAGVSSDNDQMDAEKAAAELKTQARIEALEKKNERLEKARDKELENLKKLEEKMRKHLERVQEARRKALEKQQADEQKALEKREEAAMKSMDRQREYDEATQKKRLDIFVAYTAKNLKDLNKWMKTLGFKYDDFGGDVEKKGKGWAKTIRGSLLDEIKLAGTKVLNDNAWENVGEEVGKKMIKGLGFKDMGDFNRFVRTGKRSKPKKETTESRHEGGVVGTGAGSRKGVAPTYKGLHRSEKMIRAQKGEYVVNKKASGQHRDILDSINSGNYDKEGNRIPGTGGEFSNSTSGVGGVAGLMAGAVSHMWRKGVEHAFDNAYAVGAKKEAKRRAKAASFAGNAGTYGGRKFSAEQMKNAGIIASVGSSMGMSSRDIQIGIMTAIAESGLVNLHGGDRDSQGLFQQRPSMGWGTVAQVTDPQYASRAFFGPLKAHGERNSETPWLAAQHIQRSAFSDGSNYRAWWAAAQAIFKEGLSKGGGVSGPDGGKGSGKYFRAADPGKGWRNSHDYANAMRSPVYAIGDGTVRTVQLPPSAGSGQHANAEPRGYGSYGVVSYLTTDDGKRVTYAHLYPGTQVSGRVRGGQRIALSASTGNSSGPHTHFEVNGSTNAQGAFASMGIPLRTGGTIKYDNTPTRLHKGETVLTAPLTQKFKDAVSGGAGGDTFHVTLDLRGAMIKDDVDIEKAVNKAIDARENKLGRKRVVR